LCQFKRVNNCIFTRLNKQILKKRNDIKFISIVLLLIYLFSSSVLFHNHKVEIASYEKSSSCEKTIYYSNKGEKCHHKIHLSLANKKCSLCDNHTFCPHLPQTFYTGFFNKVVSENYLYKVNAYFFLSPSVFSNRGPPSFSSHTV
jgi:hypothetical protein